MTFSPNPLPQSDRNSQLQRLSIRAFQSVLPVEQFVFRDERIDDAGVDGSLEILKDGCHTNMRSQVQLKSCEIKTTKRDGTVVLTIKVSNFNYLLNGPLGIYVLYIKETNELFYSWAPDENRRLVEMEKDWRNQETISIPLKELNALEIQNIYTRIFKEAELQRRVLEDLARTPTSDILFVSISPKTLETESSIEIESALSSVGMTLVAAGYADLVLKKIRLIDKNKAGKGRFKLIDAYANYVTGRYQLTLGLVAEAIISQDLEEEDQYFAERLCLSCQLNLGQILSEQYSQGMKELAGSSENAHSIIELQRLAYSYRSQINPSKDILSQIQQLAKEINTSERASVELKLGSRIKCLEVAGLDSIRGIFSEIFAFSVRKQSKNIPVSTISVARDHPIFIADALAARAFTHLLGFVSKIVCTTLEGIMLDQSYVDQFSIVILDWCEKAQRIYKQANIIEGEVRTQLLMAQLFEIMGQLGPARNLAQGVLKKAQLFGYQNHVATANEVISGNTMFSNSLKAARDVLVHSKGDDHNLLSLQTEEDIQEYTDFVIETYKIPPERRHFVLNDMRSSGAEIREQAYWCRHVGILQDLSHRASVTTLYATDPTRRIVCMKFDYFTDKQSPEWVSLLQNFKETYCSVCSEKNPTKAEEEKST
jgi:Domain of unknown function (DUF4365)